MKKITVFSLLAISTVMYGCSSDSASIPEPTYRITQQNAEAVNEGVYEVLSGEVIPDIDGLLEGEFRAVTQSKRAAPDALRRAVARSTTINESMNSTCSGGGSVSVSLKGSVDEDTGDGKITIDARANNCVDTVGGNTRIELDGRIKGPLEFKGFDGFDFDQFSSRLEVDGLGVSRFLGSNLEGFTRLSGRETVSYQNRQASVDYRFSLSSSGMNGERVTLETVSSIKSGFSGITSGEWRALGADGTVITYVVVANGVEYSVNDGQPVLVTWAELGW